MTKYSEKEICRQAVRADLQEEEVKSRKTHDDVFRWHYHLSASLQLTQKA